MNNIHSQTKVMTNSLQEIHSTSLARSREKHDQKAPKMYDFEDIVSFALTASSEDPSSNSVTTYPTPSRAKNSVAPPATTNASAIPGQDHEGLAKKNLNEHLGMLYFGSWDKTMKLDLVHRELQVLGFCDF
jgi:hypothetical protein